MNTPKPKPPVAKQSTDEKQKPVKKSNKRDKKPHIPQEHLTNRPFRDHPGIVALKNNLKKD